METAINQLLISAVLLAAITAETALFSMNVPGEALIPRQQLRGITGGCVVEGETCFKILECLDKLPVKILTESCCHGLRCGPLNVLGVIKGFKCLCRAQSDDCPLPHTCGQPDVCCDGTTCQTCPNCNQKSICLPCLQYGVECTDNPTACCSKGFDNPLSCQAQSSYARSYSQQKSYCYNCKTIGKSCTPTPDLPEEADECCRGLKCSSLKKCVTRSHYD